MNGATEPQPRDGGHADGGGGVRDVRQPPDGGSGATPGTTEQVAAIDATRLRVAIARLSRRLRHHQATGLTPTQLSALFTVEQGGPMRLGDVAAAERIAPSTLTRIVTVLEEDQYVQRCAVPGDARASTLVITPLGRRVLERVRHETTATLAESVMLLSPGQAAALAAAIPVLEQLAEADPRPR